MGKLGSIIARTGASGELGCAAKIPSVERITNIARLWIQDRLEELAASFAVDVCGFSVMSNHIHAVLRTRPDVVDTWSDEEVARRWWRLFPKRRDDEGKPAEPEPLELRMLTADADALAERRRRLASLSWFMRCLSEPIARRANAEDQVTGHFWEGRFRCQRLLDEAAILACSVYVDLNPIRAGIAQTPEGSEYTSAQQRIEARGRESVENALLSAGEDEAGVAGTDGTVRAPDGWLCPVCVDGDSEATAGRNRNRRASNKGYLSGKRSRKAAGHTRNRRDWLRTSSGLSAPTSPFPTLALPSWLRGCD